MLEASGSPDDADPAKVRAFHYGCHLAAELLVKKGVGERSPERRKSGDASFEIAYVVVALLSDPGFAGRGAFMEFDYGLCLSEKQRSRSRTHGSTQPTVRHRLAALG